MSLWHEIGFNSRIVIIHPSYRDHRYILSTLLNLGNLRYLCFADFEECFNEPSNYDFLILDEFDRLSDETASDFLAQVLKIYPQTAIVIFSRHLPSLTEMQRLEASIFPIDEEMGLVDFYDQVHPVIEFFGFGRGAIAVNGKRKEKLLDDKQIELLFYLLEKGPTDRNALLNAFWGELSPKTAIKTLHNLKQKLKQALGIEAIIFLESSYQLNPNLIIIYDVENYRGLIDAAQYAEPKPSLAYFAQAHDIYRGDFLQLSNAVWTLCLRQELQQAQAEAQVCLGMLRAKAEQKEEALVWYGMALRNNPLRDDVLKSVIDLSIDLQMASYALGFINRYEEILHEQYDISPNKNLMLSLADNLILTQAATDIS